MIKRIFKYALPFIRVALVLVPYAFIVWVLDSEPNLNRIIYENIDHTVMQKTGMTLRFIYPNIVLYSLCQFVFVRNRQTAEKYLHSETDADFSFFRHVYKLLFFDIPTSCKTVSFCVFSVLSALWLPTDRFLSELFFGINAASAPIFKILCIILNIAFFVFSERFAYRVWHDMKGKTEYFLNDFFKPSASISGYLMRTGVMVFASFALALLTNMAGTLITIIKHFILQSIIFAVCIIVLCIFYAYARSLVKRLSFLNRLKKNAKTDGYTVKTVKKPIMSSLKSFDGFNITVEKNGKIYDCKLIPGIKRNNSMTFLANGRIKISHEVKFCKRTGQFSLFSYNTYIDYTFDSPNKKIIVLSPCPRYVFASEQEGDKPTEIDIGFDMYEYKVYAGRGFISALSYGCIEKKYDN